MEGHSDHWNTYLSCTYHIREDIPPRTTFLFVSCSLNPEPKPFIIIRSSSDYSRSQPWPNAQYMTSGPLSLHLQMDCLDLKI